MRWFQKIHGLDHLADRPAERAEDVFQVATCADLMVFQPALVTRQVWLPSIDVSIPSISSGQIEPPDFSIGDRSKQDWSRPFYTIDESYSYEIKNAVVHRTHGFITVGEYVVFESLRISDHARLPDVSGFRWIDDKTIHLPSPPAERDVDFALHAFPGGDWLTCTLLVIGEHLLHGLARGATVLLPNNEARFENEMLRLLSLPAEPVCVGENDRIRCDRLVFVPAFFSASKAPQPRVMNIVRHLLADAGISSRRDRKIYYQRQSSGASEMSNEDEICHILRAADFEIKDIDAGGVIDRMSLAASAHTIASHHRDGLINMVFAPPWVKVIEFHRNTNLDWSMRRLSSLVPASYGCLIGRQKPKGIMQSKLDATRNPWRLPVPQLQQVLR